MELLCNLTVQMCGGASAQQQHNQGSPSPHMKHQAHHQPGSVLISFQKSCSRILGHINLKASGFKSPEYLGDPVQNHAQMIKQVK